MATRPGKFVLAEGTGTAGQVPALSGSTPTWTDQSLDINALTEKTTPVGADIIVIEDSEDGYAQKKVQIDNLPGGVISGAEAQLLTNTFSATAGQTAFTLTRAPGNNKAMMSVNGVVQKQADYSISGVSVTYSGITLLLGDVVEFWYVSNYQETVISPTPGATENNYTPTGWSSATVVRLNPSAASEITGLSSDVSVQEKRLINISLYEITLAHQATGSLAANRIISVSGGLVLLPDDVIDVWYDSVTQRWRLV
jgi:hypothetical protein